MPGDKNHSVFLIKIIREASPRTVVSLLTMQKVAMKKQIGIWLDFKEAFLIELESGRDSMIFT